jgi:hypothetical protein
MSWYQKLSSITSTSEVARAAQCAMNGRPARPRRRASQPPLWSASTVGCLRAFAAATARVVARPRRRGRRRRTRCRVRRWTGRTFRTPACSMGMPCSTSKCSRLICRPCSSSRSEAVLANGTSAQRIGLRTLTSMQARPTTRIARLFRVPWFLNSRRHFSGRMASLHVGPGDLGLSCNVNI